MKKILTILVSLALLLVATSVVIADEYVRGYQRRDGTNVSPHWRSSPDENPRNNFSYPGNVNPYTGQRATGNPDTYMQRYNQQQNNSYRNPYRR